MLGNRIELQQGTVGQKSNLCNQIPRFRRKRLPFVDKITKCRGCMACPATSLNALPIASLATIMCNTAPLQIEKSNTVDQ